MTKDRLRVAGRNAQVLEERSDRVPQVMDLDQSDLVVIADTARASVWTTV